LIGLVSQAKKLMAAKRIMISGTAIRQAIPSSVGDGNVGVVPIGIPKKCATHNRIVSLVRNLFASFISMFPTRLKIAGTPKIALNLLML
jgi:hypothetical protein